MTPGTAPAAIPLLPAVLAGVFAVYTLLFLGILAFQVPPFQNPDEATHFFRAEQLSRLRVLPERLPNGAAGGFVDSGMEAVAVPFLTLALHPERKATRALYDATGRIGWTGTLAPVAFPNTAIYPPTLYLPAVAGIWVGKAIGLPVVQTLYLARFGDGLCATVLAVLAIALAGQAAPWLFAVLTLPMASALFAAVSQDGPMIASAALAAVLAAGQGRRLPGDRGFVVLCCLLAAICMGRPPYAPLACLLLLPGWRGPGHRAAAFLLVAAATLAWSGLMLRATGPTLAVPVPGVDPGRQLATLLADPARAIPVAAATSRDSAADYLEQFVGRLGNLDMPLPSFVHPVAWAALALAGGHLAWGAVRGRSFRPGRAVAVAGCGLASVVLIFLIQYLTFSPVGARAVEGVQGRYFIELALLLPVCLRTAPAARPGVWSPARAALAAALLAALAVYLSGVVDALLLRFYM